MASQTDPEHLLRTLVESGVVDHRDDGLGLTDAFGRGVERREARFRDLDPDELRSELSAIGAGVAVDAFLGTGSTAPALAAEYAEVADRTGLDHSQRLRVLSMLDTLRTAPPDEGAPEAFVPVSGERLPFHVALHDKAVVYVWRHDCPPCEAVRDDFDDLVDASARPDVGRFAVYGPDSAARLSELYDVAGGPVTLFFHHGVVDARLYGAHPRAVLAAELDTLRAL